jgi:hypothetical protein
MLLKSLIIGTLIYSSSSAAMTYTYDEKFSGIWAGVPGTPISLFTHIASSPTLVTASNPTLFPNSVLTTDVIENVTTCAPCTSIELFNNGDKIFTQNTIAPDGGLVLNSTTGLVDNSYQGAIIITGGTGIFKNASGGGHYFATDFGVLNVDGPQIFTFNPSGKWDFEQTLTINIAPVPEPENYAMLLVGLSLMGFVARNRKIQQL